MGSGEDLLDRTTRWMTDNVQGAYTAVDPKDGGFRVNSGTCLLVCCYVNSLGKVLLKGGPPKSQGGQRVRQDFERFREFLRRCMSDFLNESAQKPLPPTPKGRTGGDEWLYEVFRCGFVHGFYAGVNGGWNRNPHSNDYWLQVQPLIVLNIDRLVRGFNDGLVAFRAIAAADPDLRTRFRDYILHA